MSNRFALAALAAACVAAAAGGGYLATRQNAVSAPAAAQTQPAPAVASTVTPAPAAPAVQETEAVVGDNGRPAAAAPSTRRSSRRAEAADRTARGSRMDQTAKRAESSSASQRPAGSPGVLTSTWPSSASEQVPVTPPAPSTMPPSEVSAPHADDHPAQEPARPVEPSKPAFDELVISRDSVIGLQLDNRVSSETARVEDRVDAHVSRDVKVGDRVAIPSGARVIGSVTQVDRGGKFKEQARLGIRFHTIVLGDGTRLPISTETIVRVGDAPGNSSAAKIGGGAVGGAILGAILGGAKGAAIGATAGAGAGTAAVTAGDRSSVVLAAGTPLTPRILSPVSVTVEREREEQ